jgi:hypothetical protein
MRRPSTAANVAVIRRRYREAGERTVKTFRFQQSDKRTWTYTVEDMNE